jgi:protein-S-isoprenylcysteine O-methyltransferase Ste14
MAAPPWWKGARGEWLVGVQVLLMGLVVFGPRTWHGWPTVPFPAGRWVSLLGLVLLTSGAALAASGILKLGGALTPLPYPAPGAVLRETGVYRFVRHPMYCGVLIGALGWALVRRGWLTIVYVLVAWAFIEVKVRREEAWLLERFPDYAAYQRRVRKFIPFVY